MVDPDTGEIVFRSKVVEQILETKVLPITLDKVITEKKRGRSRKYTKENIPVKIHLTWSAKRAEKDRMLERPKKRLDKPYQLKAAIKRGGNQFLQMEVDTKDWKLDEAKIQDAASYDGYYAVITNNINLSTEQVSKIYSGLWKIEESFRMLKTDIRARPVFVWNDEHIIKGHFAICFISLCMLRYAQTCLMSRKRRVYQPRRLCKLFMIHLF